MSGRVPNGPEVDTITPAGSDLINLFDASNSNAQGKATLANANAVSTGVVNVTDATVTLSQATHANRVVTLNRAAGVTVTLPAATGTGDVYTIAIALGDRDWETHLAQP